MTVANEDLTDRVAYCVVKRNCDGPSFLSHDERPRSRVVGPRWTCQSCGGFVMAQDDGDTAEAEEDRAVNGLGT